MVLTDAAWGERMLIELKAGLLSFVVGVVGITAITIATGTNKTAPVTAAANRISTHQRPTGVAAARIGQQQVAARGHAAIAAAAFNTPHPAPMSAWRRAYIQTHGHQPPTTGHHA